MHLLALAKVCGQGEDPAQWACLTEQKSPKPREGLLDLSGPDAAWRCCGPLGDGADDRVGIIPRIRLCQSRPDLVQERPPHGDKRRDVHELTRVGPQIAEGNDILLRKVSCDPHQLGDLLSRYGGFKPI